MTVLDPYRTAARLIRGSVLHTPLVHSPTLSRMFGADIYLKLENLQKTGSFKIRGAVCKLKTGLSGIGPEGVVAASAGNHAQGVALAARQAGVPATIVMPGWASISKQEATRGYGGRVVIAGDTIDESLQEARRLARSGMTFIHPFDDPDIIAGQGTIALEILADLPDVDVIVVPVGGGGLISGIAAAAKALRPSVRVLGVQASACPSAAVSLNTGRPTTVASTTSIADGITVRTPGETTFRMMRRHVDAMLLVEEEHIAAAILMLLERKKTLAEGAGAVPLAALIKGGMSDIAGRKVVLVISGGNVDSPLLGRILSRGMIQNGRTVRFRVQLDDIPGSLARLLERVALHQANVLHIHHERYVRDTPLLTTRVELELETRGHDHVQDVIRALKAAGYVLTGCDASLGD